MSFRRLLVLVCAAFLGAASAPAARASGDLAVAEIADPSLKPLVVIRFNQPRVYFERSLYGAVSKAVAVKPSVQFDVVSVIPSTGDEARDVRLQASAETHLRRVLEVMTDMGIPSSRTAVRREVDRGVEHSEVHVFVR